MNAHILSGNKIRVGRNSRTVYTSIHAENGIWNAGGQACAGAADFIKISRKMFSSPLNNIPCSRLPTPHDPPM